MQYALCGLNDPVRFAFFIFAAGQTFYFGIEAELYSVRIRVLCKSDGSPERTDDPGCRRIESGYRNMSDRRLQLFQAFAAYDLQVFHTILDPVFLEGFQLGNIFFTQGKNEGTVVLIGKIEFFCQLRIHLAAKQVVLGHQRAVCCVKSGVYDRRIGLGCAGTDILCPLQDTERPFESGEETGYGTAGHARSDNDYIIHE